MFAFWDYAMTKSMYISILLVLLVLLGLLALAGIQASAEPAELACTRLDRVVQEVDYRRRAGSAIRLKFGAEPSQPFVIEGVERCGDTVIVYFQIDEESTDPVSHVFFDLKRGEVRVRLGE